MPSPLRTNPNPTSGSPNGSPDGRPRRGRLNNHKIEPIQEGITNEDLFAYERSINEREKELFECQSMTLKKSQNQTAHMVSLNEELQRYYENKAAELETWKKAFWVVVAVAVIAIVAVIVLALLL